MGNLLLAEPAPVNPRSEMAIARYNQILGSSALSDEDKAELHLQRRAQTLLSALYTINDDVIIGLSKAPANRSRATLKAASPRSKWKGLTLGKLAIAMVKWFSCVGGSPQPIPVQRRHLERESK